jgi:Arc/MetJ-type ribon-helix-helix transcriptional regulator
MEVHLTDDQKAFIRQAIDAGRIAREEDAVQEALSLWERRERRRAEILAAVDQAEASLASGEGRRITTRPEAAQLADEIKKVRPLPPQFHKVCGNERMWRHSSIECLARHYSFRRATTGSTRDARRAGTRHARAATPSRIRDTAQIVGK